MSKHFIIGTAGHIDHGKTALIKALTGDDCDTHKEEKERGITINLGFSHLDFENGDSFGIVDVPGHKDFIKTMIAGSSGIDMVLLVVAADSGVMPQTREHLNIIEMLGISKGIVVLTKCDLVDDDMKELAKLEIMEFLEGGVLENKSIVEVSAINGQGIPELKNEIQQQALKIVPKTTRGFFRMYIDRIFNIKGKGIVVTGSVLNGEHNEGDELYLLPGRERKVKSKALQRHGADVKRIQAGDRAAINLSGLKLEDFERGMILTSQKIDDINMLDAEIQLFQPEVKLKVWSEVLFHTGVFSTRARIHLLDPDELTNDSKGLAQVHLEKPINVLVKDKFVIRNTSNDLTLGGGTVIDVDPLHHKRRTKKVKEQLATLADALLYSKDPIELIETELNKSESPLSLFKLAENLQFTENELKEIIDKQDHEFLQHTIKQDVFIFNKTFKNSFEHKIISFLSDYHANNSMEESGMPSKALIGKISSNTALYGLFDELLNDMHARKLLRIVEGTWILAGHKVKINKKTEGQLEWLEKTLKGYAKELATIKDIEEKAKRENIQPERLRVLLKFLANKRTLITSNNFYLHAEVVDRLKTILVKELKSKPKGINEKEMRLLLDITKKMVQVLLSILIQEGVVKKESFYIHLA